ncbi:hypothetical protein BC936DRAFT_148006 [Jimgerdemannia flammicorona]|uniref:Uncharacterized protein n=1 Tax=Jimgerdemannia flammicorona TaxID=994334 RepID=A0A433D3Z6_9FUNG|nr:hypothetical protein BC936DRAFT_148006 [Jimgerdemannia flammicorona]
MTRTLVFLFLPFQPFKSYQHFMPHSSSPTLLTLAVITPNHKPHLAIVQMNTLSFEDGCVYSQDEHKASQRSMVCEDHQQQLIQEFSSFIIHCSGQCLQTFVLVAITDFDLSS